MKIELTKTEDTLTIALIGRLDTTTAPDFEKTINECLDGITKLELDYQRLVYSSSAGLRVMLKAYKKMTQSGGSMEIYGVNDEILEVLNNTGLLEKFNVNRKQ